MIPHDCICHHRHRTTTSAAVASDCALPQQHRTNGSSAAPQGTSSFCTLTGALAAAEAAVQAASDNANRRPRMPPVCSGTDAADATDCGRVHSARGQYSNPSPPAGYHRLPLITEPKACNPGRSRDRTAGRLWSRPEPAQGGLPAIAAHSKDAALSQFQLFRGLETASERASSASPASKYYSNSGMAERKVQRTLRPTPPSQGMLQLIEENAAANMLCGI